MQRRCLMLTAAVIFGGTGVASQAQAQLDPRQILAGVIMQLQTGQPNPGWFGPVLWQTLALQTNGTGFIPLLAQGGPVINIQVTQQQQLPNGMMFQLVSSQQGGLQLGWNMGISTMTNKIEFLSFSPAQQTPPLPSPGPLPTPTTPTTPAPSPGPGTGTPTPRTTGEACQRFPNLC